ncbi:hypothetical protein BH23ACT5_BH23ACT5_03720 [soil metagenome]
MALRHPQTATDRWPVAPIVGQFNESDTPLAFLSMHIAPVVIVPHSEGPEGWTAALSEVADALELHAGLPVTLRVPGAAIDHVWRSEPALADRLAAESVSWLAGGWSDPVLSDLPLPSRYLQLAREQAAMTMAGLTPSGLWVGDAWEPALVSFALESGFSVVFMDVGLLPSSGGQPGAVERAGEVAIAVPVGPSPEPFAPDGLRSVRVDAADLSAFCELRHGLLITAEDYLLNHHPGPPLSPAVSSPPRAADTEPFYRKLLLVAVGESDRKGNVEELLALQSLEFVTGDGGGVAPHERLITARRGLERGRYRGDSWVVVREVDWDADGIDEIQVETATTSLVVDPVLGLIDVWDDKARQWPILAVQPVMSASVCKQLEPDGSERRQAPLRLERRTEGRSEAQLRLLDGAGGHYRVALTDAELTIEIAVAVLAAVRVGPELPVSMEASHTRLRADGGEWTDVSEPLTVSGHRFRLTDDTHTLVISSSRPIDLLIRPLEGHGLNIWPHWTANGDTRNAVTLTPS